MLAASHALVGAAIASASWQVHPTLAYLLALLSHPVLDFLPHWDLNTRFNHQPKLRLITLSLTDAALGIIPGLLLFADQVPVTVLLVTMLLAQGPDWLEAPYHVLDWRWPPFSTIKQFQSRWHHKLDLPWGLILQLVFISILIIWVR